MYRMRWLCTRQDNVLVRSLVRFRTVLHQWRFILLFLDKELMSAERFRDLLLAQKDLAIGAKGYALDPQHFIWRLLLKSGNSKAMCGNKLRREVCINSFYSFEGFKGGVGFNSFLLDYILNLSPNKNQVDQRFISMKIILLYTLIFIKSQRLLLVPFPWHKQVYVTGTEQDVELVKVCQLGSVLQNYLGNRFRNC